ncbi:MAG: SLC13 family permease [Brumimicrobium sp.]|nr:SLC13 family permease [Brumimicrobium sp.]
MSFDLIVTIVVIVIATVLFATEAVRIDLVALLIISSLVLTGVITPAEGVAGFSNSATITVAFMFALSAAVLKTGALQYVTHKLARIFNRNFNQGMLLMMLVIAVISAFINNTPVVAVFIPVIIQIANTSGHDPKKMLIPLSFASIFGGTCTLVGTSTNILVSGIAVKENLDPISMFQLTPVGIIFLAVGILYMLFIGIPLLPSSKKKEKGQPGEKFDIKNYLTELEIVKKEVPNNTSVRLEVLTDLEIDVLELRRGKKSFALPSQETELYVGDIIKVRCNSENIKKLKNWAVANEYFSVKVGNADLRSKNSSLLELIIVANSPLDGNKLGNIDFKGTYRTIPLAVKQRKDVMHENLSDIRLKAGDIILAEVKNEFIEEMYKNENEPQAPFAVLSQDKIVTFDKRQFAIVLTVIMAVILTATFGIIDIMTGAISGVSLIVLLGIINMKELYKAIDWKVVFLLAGALSLGTAMSNSGLDTMMAQGVVNYLQDWGPIAVLSGIYLLTTVLTNLLTNNAAAALLAPIAIVTANSLGLSPVPFLAAIAFAGSASFITPIGYQTNTMVYSAGKYKFMDFVKTGGLLNLIFWILATFLIPWVYGF